MASFVHITDARTVAAIRRTGIRPARWRGESRWVFCTPMVPDYSVSFQWGRELRRARAGRVCAVQFRIPDEETVRVGPYQGPHEAATAAEATRRFLEARDPRGLEVRIGRRIDPGEIVAVRAVNGATGWRYYPDSNGKEPIWPAPGSFKARKRRAAIDARDRSPFLDLPFDAGEA